MHVIQSQLTNYSYHSFVQKQLKLVRWWIYNHEYTMDSGRALPFTSDQEMIFMNFMNDHPKNFPKQKIEIFNSSNLVLPVIAIKDQDTDIEKPCILLIRQKPPDPAAEVSRMVDIVLQNNELPVRLPFDVAGEIILENTK
ncbi:MAG: hypothetical protein ABIO04_12600 [Ferruginibacter sp.]